MKIDVAGWFVFLDKALYDGQIIVNCQLLIVIGQLTIDNDWKLYFHQKTAEKKGNE